MRLFDVSENQVIEIGIGVSLLAFTFPGFENTNGNAAYSGTL